MMYHLDCSYCALNITAAGRVWAHAAQRLHTRHIRELHMSNLVCMTFLAGSEPC